MSKSSFLNNKNVTKSNIAIFCILLMFVGLLRSRLFLSLGMILLGINALWNIPPREWLKQKWWLMGVAWVAMYALSGLWSTNKAEWGVYLQMKLPVLLLPLAFSFLPPFTARQLQLLTISIGMMLLGGAFYSVSFLIFDYTHYIQEYNVSHILPTPVYGDYICFSTSCALFIIWSMYMWPRLLSKSAQYVVSIIALLLAVYLHILASKSGLVAFYLFTFSWAIYTVFAKRSIAGIAGVLCIPLFLYCAVTFIPTLHERKAHIVYTYYRFRDQDKSGTLGDLSRLISYDVSMKIIKEHPLLGVGTGDMLAEMNTGYDKWYPQVTEERNRLIPHNQFLTIALGCGIPAMLFFLIWVFMPLFHLPEGRDRFFFIITWSVLLIQLMIEPFLEGQFGVFVYLFFLLMLRQVIQNKDRISTNL